jgi:hypothetical protein
MIPIDYSKLGDPPPSPRLGRIAALFVGFEIASIPLIFALEPFAFSYYHYWMDWTIPAYLILLFAAGFITSSLAMMQRQSRTTLAAISFSVSAALLVLYILVFVGIFY